MSRKPSPKQTLAALDRVSAGEVWEPEQPADTWQHVSQPVTRIIQHRINEAAE